MDPKGASGARRHIKEVIDPTSSLSLVPVNGSSQDQPLQASNTNDQGKMVKFLCLVEVFIAIFVISGFAVEETSTVDGGNQSGASNNISNESLEMPPLPQMDNSDGDHF